MARLMLGSLMLGSLMLGVSALAVPATAIAQTPRSVLPIAAPPFSGVIAKDAARSTPEPLHQVRAPAGAPNIFLFMSDDVGFAMASTFGGPVPTPNFDRIARTGQRYNRFHTTALCSPSRAALLTGRNHHNAGTGNLSDLAVGYSGYNARFPASTATIAQTLRLNGYSTAMFGKHHNVTGSDRSPTGPFDMWPTGLGFEYFFGFINGDTDQYRPNVVRNTAVLPDPLGKPVLFERRMADDALTWVRNQRASAPEKPFFVYYAPGSMHAPHQVAPEYVARFKGKFDGGWDKLREETYRRQLAMGIIPAGTKLTPRPAEIPAWSTLSAPQKAFAARAMEVAAAMQAYQDEQIGRILDEFDRIGVSNELLIALVVGDNGASSGGGTSGTLNELQNFNGLEEDDTWLAANIDRLGGEFTYPDYPKGWAWALSAPFPGLKANAARLGGVRNGFILNWKGHVNRPNSICAEFGHLTDIAPTLLEAAKIPAPESVFGVAQKPMDGQSLLPSLSNCQPEKPRTQYFEMSGTLGLYHNGWFASRAPKGDPNHQVGAESQSSEWELYDLRTDFSQSTNMASRNAAKLVELVGLFDREARRNNVYPLNATAALRTSGGTANPGQIDLWGADTSIPAMGGRFPRGASFELNAEFELASSRASGVVAALASRFGGWSLFLDQGRPTFVYARSTHPNDIFRFSSSRELPQGPTKLRLSFSNTGKGQAQARLFSGETELGSMAIPRTFPGPAGLGEQLDVGRDTGVPVTEYHRPAGELEGNIRHVWLTFAR